MEFKFQAGKDHPSSYIAASPRGANFTSQALLRGGAYLGANPRRPDPSQNPIMIHTKSMVREVEKERIREELIAAEIQRKCGLEEVRRELAYEREVALQRQAEQFSLQGMNHKKAKEEQLVVRSKPGGGNRIEAAVEAAEMMNPNKVKELSCDPCNVRATSEKDLKNGHFQGRKHKAKVKDRELLIATKSAGGGNDIEAKQFGIPKKVKMEWSCDLCRVTAPSREGLNEHLHGKRHKAKELELLIASKFAYSSPFPKKASNFNKLAKDIVTRNIGQQKKLQRQVPNNKIVGKQPLLHSKEQCNLECDSESMIKRKKESRAYWVAKTKEENLVAITTTKDPTLKNTDKSNKFVKNVMNTSTSKWQQTPQIGQPERQPQVPKIHIGSAECGKVDVGVTNERKENSEADVNKVVEIVEVKQIIGNHQEEQVVESETRSIGNHQDEQEVASETTDVVRVPSKEEMSGRTEDRA